MDNLISLLVLVAQWCPAPTGGSLGLAVSNMQEDSNKCRAQFIKCIDEKKLVNAIVTKDTDRQALLECAGQAKP